MSIIRRYELTRSDAAKILEVSVSRVRALERAGRLRTVKRGRAVYLSEDQVLALKEKMETTSAGSVAARAFALFDDGVTDLRTVVRQLRIDPGRAERLYERWRSPDLEERMRAKIRDEQEALARKVAKAEEAKTKADHKQWLKELRDDET